MGHWDEFVWLSLAIVYYVSDVIKRVYDLGARARICMVKFGNEATVQSGLLRFILTVQIDLDKEGNDEPPLNAFHQLFTHHHLLFRSGTLR